MKVMCVKPYINFKRALLPEELAEYTSTLKEAKKITGQTGKSVFIMPSTCLPQSNNLNTGVGNLSSDLAQEYIEYMHKYLDFNIVEDLPPGQVNPTRTGFYCSYNSSALGLGIHHINPELLTTSDFANLLTKEEFNKIVTSNNTETKEEIVNFKNVMDQDGAQNQVLKKAFTRFKELDKSHPLKQRFDTYTQENADWLNFPRKGEDDQEFFKFKQFLAEEHLKIGKEKLNKKGLKLYGDCLIGFSMDEINAFPNAFKRDHRIGLPDWNLVSLDFDTVLDDNSDASKLLKRKIQLFARRYDSIRFDVAWAYVTPIMTPKDVKEIKEENRRYLNSALLEKIEHWVKEVKGDDFDINDLIYEFEAGPDEFRAFDNYGKLIAPLVGRTKIYSSTYMNHTGDDKWGYNAAYLGRGWKPEEFMVGVGNHDPQPLRQIACGIKEEKRIFSRKEGKYVTAYEDNKVRAIRPLAEELKIPEKSLEEPTEFAKSKFAEPMMGKNNHVFYMDVFGREERFDMQGFNSTKHPEKNYGYKVPAKYKKAYHKGIQEGFGFNMMDSLERVFKAKGYDKTHPELYNRIIKFRDILNEKDIISETSKPQNTKNNFGKYLAVGIGIFGLLFGLDWFLRKRLKQEPEQKKINA